jgi:HEPN domain-containing protein
MIGESVTMSNSRERAHTLFELACQYKNAADLLSERFESGTNNLPIREPIYFLYHHATELVLKAFLTSHSKRTSSSHDIADLYEASRKEGLIVKEDRVTKVTFTVIQSKTSGFPLTPLGPAGGFPLTPLGSAMLLAVSSRR